MCQLCAEFRPYLADECEYSQIYQHADATVEDGQVQSFGTRSYAEFDNISEYIQSGYWNDSGSAPRDYSQDSDGIITVHIANLNAAGRTVAQLALDTWEEVSGLEFQVVANSGDAQLRFDDENSGAYASTSYYPTTGEAVYSNINVHKTWIGNYGSEVGSYGYQTYLHEIGHALGLGHTGHYNGSANFGSDREEDNDSWQASVMSYFSQSENTFINASYAYTLTLMQADILAIQSLYGLETTTRTEDTTYGFNSTAGGYLDDLDTLLGSGAATIYDDGGTDTLNFSGSAHDQWIDLDPGAISNVMGRVGNLIIDRSTLIENAIGGTGNDIIWGNDLDNRITGGAGADTLLGGAGDDTIFVEGEDVINGGAGADTAVLSGAYADYTLVSTNGSDTAVLEHTATGAQVSFSLVNMFTFSDRSVAFGDLESGTPSDPGDPITPDEPTDPVDPGDDDPVVPTDGTYTLVVDRGRLYLNNGSTVFPVLDEGGNEVRENKFTDWTFVTGIDADGGIRILFYNAVEGLWRDWALTAGGQYVAGGDSYGAVALARIEAVYGDVNGDDAIAQMPADPLLIVIDKALKLSTAEGDIAIVDDRGRDIGESAVRDWTTLKVIATDDGYRIAYGDDAGHFQVWTVAATGALVETSITRGTVALARLEAEFGDLNGDGAIAPMPARPEIIELDGDLFISTAEGDIALLDERGRQMDDRDVRDWTIAGTLQDENGFRIVLINEEGGLIDWQTDANGLLFEAVETRGTVALARLELIFGDLNGDGVVEAMPTNPELIVLDRLLQLSTRDGVIFITDEKGRAIGENEIRDQTIVRSVADDDGYRVLLRDADGLLRDLTVDGNGTLIGDVLTTGAVSLARLEAIYGDIDGDGAVATMPADPLLIALDRSLVLTTADGDLALLDDRGREVRDSVLRDWTVLRAIETDTGYAVVLEGEEGIYVEWTISANGQITDASEMNGTMAVARLEQSFGDIDGNGQINALPDNPELVVVDRNSMISTKDGMIDLTYSNGRAVRDKLYREWDFVKAIEEDDGSFRLLFRDKDDADRYADWFVGADGSRDDRLVVAGDVGFARLEQDYGDIDGDGSVAGLPANPEVVAVEGYLWISAADAVVSLRGTNSRSVRDKFLDDWDFVAALSSDDGYRLVFRDADDRYAEWTVTRDGRALDINIVTGNVAVAVLEQEFGDLDGDGAVAAIPDAPEVVALDGGLFVSTEDGLLEITTMRGRHASDKLFRKNTFVDSVADGDGFRMLIQDRDGVYDEWILDADGQRVGATKSVGTVALARLEQIYGDIDGNGAVNTMPGDPEVVAMNRKLFISSAEGMEILLDTNGRAVSDRMLRDHDLLGTKEQEDGTIRILFQQKSDGMFYDWEIGANGTATSADYLYGDVALARMEAIHGDVNGDGALAAMPDDPEVLVIDRTVVLSTADGIVQMIDDRGRNMRENALRDWTVQVAREEDDGSYTLVMQNDDDTSLLAEWTVASSGALVSIEQSAGQVALSRLELEFGDIDGDGVVDAMPEAAELVALDRDLFLSSADGFLALTDTKGAAMTDKLLRSKEVEAVHVDGDQGHVLLNNGQGTWTEWSFDASGAIMDSAVMNGAVALARLEAFYGDLNGDAQLAAMPDTPEVIGLQGVLTLATEDGFDAVLRKSGKAMTAGSVKDLSIVATSEDQNGYTLLWEMEDGRFEHWVLDENAQIESRTRFDNAETGALEPVFDADAMSALRVQADGFEFDLGRAGAIEDELSALNAVREDPVDTRAADLAMLDAMEDTLVLFDADHGLL